MADDHLVRLLVNRLWQYISDSDQDETLSGDCSSMTSALVDYARSPLYYPKVVLSVASSSLLAVDLLKTGEWTRRKSHILRVLILVLSLEQMDVPGIAPASLDVDIMDICYRLITEIHSLRSSSSTEAQSIESDLIRLLSKFHWDSFQQLMFQSFRDLLHSNQPSQ